MPQLLQVIGIQNRKTKHFGFRKIFSNELFVLLHPDFLKKHKRQDTIPKEGIFRGYWIYECHKWQKRYGEAVRECSFFGIKKKINSKSGNKLLEKSRRD